jgi:nucleoside-diphosphate-sugar epimerase
MSELVTGGTGYVGSHAAAALVRDGHEVRLLVRSPERVATSLGPLGRPMSPPGTHRPVRSSFLRYS